MTIQEEVQLLVKDIDRIMQELFEMRLRLARSLQRMPDTKVSSREWEAFGIWADREDMKGLTSSEWLDRLRASQWGSHG